ncbi:MAG: Fe-S protein assembly co-chaperone HscB [Myxococcaceae bacterium]
MNSYFDVFALPPRHAMDVTALEKQFRELSLKHHPDRVTSGDARERRIAVEQTTTLNDAFKTLKDPTRRAFYLLKLRGVDLDRDEQGAVSEEIKRLTTPPMEFLEEMMELREALSETRARKDVVAAQKMGEDVQKRKMAALEEAVAALDEAASPTSLEKAARALGRVRYFTRFLEEVDAIEEEALS